jgi:hypothetical protein
MKPKSIQVGDWVGIVTPEIFVRCGYPMDYRETLDKVSVTCHAEIRHFIQDCVKKFYIPKREAYPYCQRKIAAALAYQLMQELRFGGTSREIYTKTIESVRGLVFQVMGRRRVSTGRYFPSETTYSADWEREDIPGGLSDRHDHTILELEDPANRVGEKYYFEIEARHVEKALHC